MYQDGTWYGSIGLGPRDFVLDGTELPLSKKGSEPPPQFLPHFYCGQTARCTKMPLGMEVVLSPRDFVLDGTQLPHLKKAAEPLPNFWPMFIVAKQLDGSRRHLARRYVSAQATLC